MTLLAPLHPPDALQLVALVDDQLSVVLPPVATLADEAVSDNVGAGTIITLTDCEADPPGPAHVIENVLLALTGAETSAPCVALSPPQAPLAVQAAALVDVQLNVVVAPEPSEVGAALRLTVGAGTFTPTVTDFEVAPPVPVHVSV